MTTIYVLLTGAVLIGFMFLISYLWDRVDKLQEQVNQQDFDINHNRIAVNHLAKDVHKGSCPHGVEKH